MEEKVDAMALKIARAWSKFARGWPIPTDAKIDDFEEPELLRAMARAALAHADEPTSSEEPRSGDTSK